MTEEEKANLARKMSKLETAVENRRAADKKVKNCVNLVEAQRTVIKVVYGEEIERLKKSEGK